MFKLLKKIFNLVDFDKLRIREEKKQFFIAFLLFVSSLGIVTSHVILLSMFLIIITSNYKKINITKDLRLIIVIAILSLFNELFFLIVNVDAKVGVLEIIPYATLIYITVWASKVCDTRILKWLVVLSVFEIFVGMWERSVGINSLFASSAVDMSDYGEDALLYNLKVNGLGVNSTSIGYKSFLSLLLYERFPDCRFIKKWLFVSLCIIGTILSFNRTSMVGIAAYFGLYFLHKGNRKYFVLLIIIVIGALFYFPTLYDGLVMQVTRGGAGSENMLSGREDIVPIYLSFIKEHLLFGNGSFKLFFYSGDIMLHAHNAYLQTIATNGILISLLYLLLLCLIINSHNIKFAFPILVCGMTQAFILWGTSLNDFVLYTLLLNFNLPNNEISKTVRLNYLK